MPLVCSGAGGASAERTLEAFSEPDLAVLGLELDLGAPVAAAGFFT